LAERMRSSYFIELRSSLAKAKVLDDPQLAIDLFMMHRESAFSNEVETLTGVITTNHDGLLQVASQRVFGAINPGFEFESKSFNQARHDTPPILQLHGSFSWRFDMPIRIEKLNQQSKYADTIWIPPTILKESKTYPFNKLSGRAYELLARECDVLRVVGTSLNQNDWNILSLIFNAQRHREAAGGQAFLVELIMPRLSGEAIGKECAYLRNLITIGFLTEGRFAAYNDDNMPPLRPEDDMANPFAYWLNEKLEFHRRRSELAYVRQSPQSPAIEVTT
jgi:SIR2-like protein